MHVAVSSHPSVVRRPARRGDARRRRPVVPARSGRAPVGAIDGSGSRTVQRHGERERYGRGGHGGPTPWRRARHGGPHGSSSTATTDSLRVVRARRSAAEGRRRRPRCTSRRGAAGSAAARCRPRWNSPPRWRDLRSGSIVINELTTVAAGYSLAQFAEGGSLGGPTPGLRTRRRCRGTWSTSRPATRRAVPAASLRTALATETLSSFNSLASIIAGCAAGTNDCAAFLDAATDAWGARPGDHLGGDDAAADQSGGRCARRVRAGARPILSSQPVRQSAPTAWILALRFYGNGQQFNGPGQRRVRRTRACLGQQQCGVVRRPEKVCPGLEMFLLDPYARGRPMQTFTGGGLNGAGFGIALDPRRRRLGGQLRLHGLGVPESRADLEQRVGVPSGRAPGLGRRRIPRRAAELAAGNQVGRRTETSGSRAAATTRS